MLHGGFNFNWNTYPSFNSSGMWCCDLGKKNTTHVLEHLVFMDCVTLKLKALQSFERLGNTHPTQYHILVSSSRRRHHHHHHHHHGCVNLKSHIKYLPSFIIHRTPHNLHFKVTHYVRILQFESPGLGYRLDGLGSVPGTGNKIHSSPKRPDCLWETPNLLVNG